MQLFSAILVGIGVVVGLIVLTVLVAFLIELVKAFGQMGKGKIEQKGDAGDEPRGDGRI
jgi:hypothetical protein